MKKQIDMHINTEKLHYVKVPSEHIVIDFDIPDKDGNKSLERNLEEAAKWPPTYAELSKSGAGIHLHYIYTGDTTKLSSVYEEHIEVKVFNGRIEPEFHACLKEIARQQGTTMADVICSYILDTVMKDRNGKITDGESWINEYKKRQKVRKLWRDEV